MKFRDWFTEEVGTSMSYGGAYLQALVGTNSNMPCRSKYVTMDGGEDKPEKNMASNPDKSFGFQTTKQKKRAIESQPSNIDRSRKAVPMRDDDSFVTY